MAAFSELPVIISVALILSVARVAPSGSTLARRPQLAPAPPPPAVVFVNDLALGSSSRPSTRREAEAGGLEERRLKASPVYGPAPEARTSRRGTLVARTRELPASAVSQDIALVTAEGVRVRPSEVAGLSLPFSLPDNVPPLPAGAQPAQRHPTGSLSYGTPAGALTGRQEAAPEDAEPRQPAHPALRPPSPHTTVTYFSLGEEAKVKMMPYLMLVESLVGKQAYGPEPAAPTRTPTPPVPEPVSVSEPEVFPSNSGPSPARVYGGPGSVPGAS